MKTGFLYFREFANTRHGGEMALVSQVHVNHHCSYWWCIGKNRKIKIVANSSGALRIGARG